MQHFFLPTSFLLAFPLGGSSSYLLGGIYGAVQRQAKGACGYMHAIVSASPVQLRGTPNKGYPKRQTKSAACEGSAGYKLPPLKKLYRTVKRKPLLLKSGLVYMPQVVPAHDPGRRVAPSMRHHRPSRALNEDHPKATGLAPRKDGGMRRREPEKAMGDM